MQWRGTILFIVMIGVLFTAVASSSAPQPVLQVFVTASFAMLGLFAVLLLRRGFGGPEPPAAAPRETDSLRELRRLTANLRFDPPSTLERERGTIEVYPWPDIDEDVRMDRHALSRHLVTRLAPPAADVGLVGGNGTRRQFLSELVREGEDLRMLARLLKIDESPHGDQLSKGLEAARLGRVEECVLILQLANERLRTQVQMGLVGQLADLRPRASFERG